MLRGQSTGVVMGAIAERGKDASRLIRTVAAA
jgi:hypothetical protein